jgi:hypothetical protein
MESQEYQMTDTEKDGMKSLENQEKIGGSIWTVLLLQLKKKMIPMIEFIKQISFYALFFMGCGIVVLVIGFIWIWDQLFGNWVK